MAKYRFYLLTTYNYATFFVLFKKVNFCHAGHFSSVGALHSLNKKGFHVKKLITFLV